MDEQGQAGLSWRLDVDRGPDVSRCVGMALMKAIARFRHVYVCWSACARACECVRVCVCAGARV
eukprot:3204475-Alexandrium_andersonii.AAC.1